MMMRRTKYTHRKFLKRVFISVKVVDIYARFDVIVSINFGASFRLLEPISSTVTFVKNRSDIS